ncbi:gametocyte-specific factor 1 isoform X2 [Thalassophryne amazonica]|nr:gametocyte-specific factor 1 isoform X2 [Thalassophryne amazonica]
MAHIFKFGFNGEVKNATAERALTSQEENDAKGDDDPEKLFQCPFDKNHWIRGCRFPYHIIKCVKNHPETAREMKTCPFNARHIMPKYKLAGHTETCPNRVPLDKQNDANATGKQNWHVPVSTWVNPNMAEDWDEEIETGATPFVWGVNRNLNLAMEAKPVSNLGSNSRTPSKLPWTDYK